VYLHSWQSASWVALPASVDQVTDLIVGENDRAHVSDLIFTIDSDVKYRKLEDTCELRDEVRAKWRFASDTDCLNRDFSCHIVTFAVTTKSGEKNQKLPHHRDALGSGCRNKNIPS